MDQLQKWLQDLYEEEEELSTEPLCSLDLMVEGMASQDNEQQSHLEFGEKQTAEPQYSLTSTMTGIESEDLDKWLQEYDGQQRFSTDRQCSVSDSTVEKIGSVGKEQRSQDSEELVSSTTEPQCTSNSTKEEMELQDNEQRSQYSDEQQLSTTEPQCSLNSKVGRTELQRSQDCENQQQSPIAAEIANSKMEFGLDDLFPNSTVSRTLKPLKESTNFYVKNRKAKKRASPASHPNDMKANLNFEPVKIDLGNSEITVSTSRSGGRVVKRKTFDKQEIPMISLTLDSGEKLTLHSGEDLYNDSRLFVPHISVDDIFRKEVLGETPRELSAGAAENRAGTADEGAAANATETVQVVTDEASARTANTEIQGVARGIPEDPTVVQGNADCQTVHVQSNLENKISSKASANNLQQCQRCQVFCADKDVLKKHMRDTHVMAMCAFCNFTSYHVSALKVHMTKKHSETTIYRCFICNQSFDNEGKYETHMQTLHVNE